MEEKKKMAWLWFGQKNVTAVFFAANAKVRSIFGLCLPHSTALVLCSVPHYSLVVTKSNLRTHNLLLLHTTSSFQCERSIDERRIFRCALYCLPQHPSIAVHLLPKRTFSFWESCPSTHGCGEACAESHSPNLESELFRVKRAV